MKRSAKCKCLHCRELFVADFRNRGRQRHCGKPQCRKAAKALSLTPKQKQEVKTIWDNGEAKMKDFMSRARFKSAKAAAAYVAQERKKTADAMLATLSEPQRKKFKEQCGKVFDTAGLDQD